MSYDHSRVIIKNMPAFVREKEWLVWSALCSQQDRNKLDEWKTLEKKIRDIVHNKHKALARAVEGRLWRDFDFVNINAEEDLFRKMGKFMYAKQLDKAASKIIAPPNPSPPGADYETSLKCQECSPASSTASSTQPTWKAHRYSRICKSFLTGTACPHESKGKQCNFAHTIQELDHGLKNCNWGHRCFRKKGENPCCCRHPVGTGFETVEQVIARMNLQKPLIDGDRPKIVQTKEQQIENLRTSIDKQKEQLAKLLGECGPTVEAVEDQTLCPPVLLPRQLTTTGTMKARTTSPACTDHLKINLGACSPDY